jgi:mannose-6-phosphate isomerase-like protein (cupin superfamily)
MTGLAEAGYSRFLPDNARHSLRNIGATPIMYIVVWVPAPDR